MTEVATIVIGSLAATMLLIGGAAVSWAQPAGGVAPFGGELRGIMRVTGKVVCVGCTVKDVEQAQPQLTNLYLLKRVGHERQRVVMSINNVSEPQRWDAVVFPHQVLVRSTGAIFRKLSAEQNLYKSLTVSGLLRNDRVMDVQDVTVAE